MKAIKKYTENGRPAFRLTEAPEPVIQRDDEVKIAITHIGICMSDIHVLHGTMQMPDDNIIGHECCGVVTETGKKVTHIRKGDHVVFELAKGACMKCKVCKSGHYELCPSKTPPGWSSQGVYAEYTVQPEFCVHKISPAIPGEVAAMAEPIAICVYGCMERGKIQKDDFTVIYGMGSIGLFSLIVLRDAGIKNIVCVSPVRNGRQRLELAKELGATHIIEAEKDVIKEILSLRKGQKADCVVDCSGSPQAINQGMNLLRKGGKFIALGISAQHPILFEYNTGVLQVIDLVFSATSSHAAWNKTTGILKRNARKISKVITHQFPLSQYQEAFHVLETRQAIKVVLTTGISL